MLGVQYHCMVIETNTKTDVNSGQTPVNVFDQPIFAPIKQIQWRYQEKFGNYFSLFGSFHIEKSLLFLHGGSILDTGLLKLLEINNLFICSIRTVISSLIIRKEQGKHWSCQYLLFTRIFLFPIHLWVLLFPILIGWMRYLLLR